MRVNKKRIEMQVAIDMHKEKDIEEKLYYACISDSPVELEIEGVLYKDVKVFGGSYNAGDDGSYEAFFDLVIQVDNEEKVET